MNAKRTYQILILKRLARLEELGFATGRHIHGDMIDALIDNQDSDKEVVERNYIQTDEGNKTAKALLELGQWAEKNHLKGPANLSTDHNKYIYDK